MKQNKLTSIVLIFLGLTVVISAVFIFLLLIGLMIEKKLTSETIMVGVINACAVLVGVGATIWIFRTQTNLQIEKNATDFRLSKLPYIEVVTEYTSANSDKFKNCLQLTFNKYGDISNKYYYSYITLYNFGNSAALHIKFNTESNSEVGNKAIHLAQNMTKYLYLSYKEVEDLADKHEIPFDLTYSDTIGNKYVQKLIFKVQINNYDKELVIKSNLPPVLLENK